MRIIYGLFSLIDWFVYWIASMIFRVIIDISDTPFFKDEQITEIAQRIYIIVGVLMLFKLVVSAIQYIMNPDSFDDKEKGLFGLLKNMLMTIVLMVLVPVVFDFAMSIQDTIVEAIPKIILGGDAVSYETEKERSQQLDRTGTELSYTVLSSFLREQNGGTVGTYCPYDSTSACQSYCALDDKSKCKTGEIHNLDTFLAHAAGGCPLLFGNTKDCKYDYMVIISTLCGGFLVYVLLSMALDVAIRTVKLGIIRMLAPIPITSYMFGKDKFNKFVKTSFQVYTDLFIRMAIIYFIVFAIQSLVRAGILDPLNLGGNGVADTGNWFRNTIVNIVLIFGLLMFAKSAPKFLSELLGLPDIGSGELADMFKPAWQRAGGAAGQIINPFTTAAANYRQARLENGRSRGESLRRALGGLGRGALDSVQGMMAGDDWAKMRNRHDAAVKRSSDHTLRMIKRERDADVNARKLNRLRSRLRDLRSSLATRTFDAATISQAESDYNNHINGIRSRMNTLRSELNSGTLSSSERAAKALELQNLNSQLLTLSSADGKQRWINAKAEQNVRIGEINTAISNNRARIQAINAEIAAGVTDERRGELEIERQGLLTESRNLAEESRNITTDTNVDIQQRIDAERDRQTAIQKQIEDAQKEIANVEQAQSEPIHGAFFNSFDTYFGGPGSQGKTYINFAETLGKNRSSIYTGEAMTKMKQNPEILVDENGNQIEYKTSFSTTGKSFSYSEISSLLSRFEANQVSDKELEDVGLNASTLKAAFAEIEKWAARDYINANIVYADGDRMVDGQRLSDTIHVRLKTGSKANSTIVEWWDRFENELLASGLSREETGRYHKEFLKNPGSFMAGASDLKENLLTRGTRIVDAEEPGKK